MKFSHSKLELYKQCPRKFKYRYIDKLPTKPFEHLAKGSEVHRLLEIYGNEDLKSDIKEAYNIALKFSESEIGKEILSQKSKRELCIKFKDFEPIDSDSNDYDFIGYIDRVNFTNSGLELIDYKTGKYKDPKYQDFQQLIIYAIWFFKKYSSLTEIKIRFVYVEHLQENSIVLTRDKIDDILNNLKILVKTIELDQDFHKKPNSLCDWCDFKEQCLSD